MIPRYTPAEFATLWSPEQRFRVWLEVELCACEAMEEAGLVPAGTASSLRAQKIEIDVARVDAIEKTTRHDVIAFLTHVEEKAGPPARWLHRGMTSSDVLDTSLAILLRDSADILLKSCDRLLGALAKRALEHQKTPMIGRSHGIYAEPITFGLALAGHHAEIARGRARIERARAEISVGKIAGAVGTYAHLTPEIEARALAKLGLFAETVSTQVVARDRHASFFSALALMAAGIERLATNVRHWQRSEVGEAEEAFTVGQKGSSAMPHKRNPVKSEQVTGLARVLRGYASAALEDVALWHERDISHSSVERIILPDATTLLDHMQRRVIALVEGMVVNAERMAENLELTHGALFSQRVLLALVAAGSTRDDAYRVVQRLAQQAIAERVALRSLLAADPAAASLDLDAIFDYGPFVAHAGEIVARLDEIA